MAKRRPGCRSLRIPKFEEPRTFKIPDHLGGKDNERSLHLRSKKSPIREHVKVKIPHTKRVKVFVNRFVYRNKRREINRYIFYTFEAKQGSGLFPAYFHLELHRLNSTSFDGTHDSHMRVSVSPTCIHPIP